MYYGVPVIALPRSPDHAAVAYRLGELGLGRILPRHTVTIEEIRGCIDSVMSDHTLLARVREMKSTVRGCGGAVATAEKLEEILRKSVGVECSPEH